MPLLFLILFFMSNSFCSSFLLIKLFCFSFFAFSLVPKNSIVQSRSLIAPGCAIAVFFYILQRDFSKKKVTFSECVSIGMCVPEEEDFEQRNDDKNENSFSGINSLLEF